MGGPILARTVSAFTAATIKHLGLTKIALEFASSEDPVSNNGVEHLKKESVEHLPRFYVRGCSLQGLINLSMINW